MADPPIIQLSLKIKHLAEAIDIHHSDFQKIKLFVAKGLQTPTSLDCPAQVEWLRNALMEIDKIVRSQHVS